MPWMLTHIPTGLGVCTIPTLKEGKQFCQVLNTAPGWEYMTCSKDMTPEQAAAYHAARFD